MKRDSHFNNSEYIRLNLISKIASLYRKLRKIYEHDSFFFFDTKVGEIDRILNGTLYDKDAILHRHWNSVRGKELVEIFHKLRGNNFYFYKLIDGRYYKTRPKLNVKT